MEKYLQLAYSQNLLHAPDSNFNFTFADTSFFHRMESDHLLLKGSCVAVVMVADAISKNENYESPWIEQTI